MKKGIEYTAKKCDGWNAIARRTAKGWIVDIQWYCGWRRYYLPDSAGYEFAEPLTEVGVRLLAFSAQNDGKKLGIPDRGTPQIVKDAFGSDMLVRV